MILETKTTEKPHKKFGQRLRKKGSLILGALLVFSSLFLAPLASVNAADPPPTGVGKITVTYSERNLNSRAGNAGEEYTFTAFEDAKIIDASKCNCKIVWSRTTNGTSAVVDDSNINPYKTVVTAGTGRPIITVAVTRNGASSNGTGDTNTQSPIKTDAVGDLTGGIAGLLSTVVRFLVLMITQVLYSITHYLTIPVIQVVLDMKVHDSSFSAVILSGWVFVRNVMNIFFILAMLIISLATLFRVSGDKYNYKHLLPELVLMALLINFSLVIAQLILGIADTLQAQFLPNNKDVLSALAYQMMVKPNMNLAIAPWQGTLSDVVSSIFYLFFAVAAFFTFMILAGFLVIRVVFLWFLLLTSPAAYGLRVLPQTHHYAEEWWTYFLKYAFFTPIVGFFLHIVASLTIAQSEYIAKVTQNSINTSTHVSLGQFVANALSNVLIIFFLYLAIEVAEGFGVKGANTLVHWAQHKTVQPFEFTGEYLKNKAMTAKYNATEGLAVPNKGDNKFVAGLKSAAFNIANPGIAVGERMHRLEHHTEEAKKVAVAAATRGAVYHGTKGQVDTRDNIKMKEKMEEDAMNRGLSKSPADALKKLHEMHGSSFGKTHEGHQEVRGWIKALVKNGNIVDAVKKEHGEYNSDTLREFVDHYTAGDPEADRFKGTINSMAKESKAMAAVGLDKKTEPEQNQARIDHFESLEEKDQGSVKMAGVKRGSAFYESFVQKLEDKPEIKISQKNVSYLAAPRVSAKTGQLIFENPQQRQSFDQLKKSHPNLALKLYNQAIGIKNPLTNPSAIQKATDIPTGGFYITKDANGAIKYHRLENNAEVAAAEIDPAIVETAVAKRIAQNVRPASAQAQAQNNRVNRAALTEEDDEEDDLTQN